MSASIKISPRRLTRREFGSHAGLALAGLALTSGPARPQEESRSTVAFVRSQDRAAAMKSALELLGGMDFGGKDIYLKANYNSPDPFPATTHPQTLATTVKLLRKANCGAITLIERSGMGSTNEIWKLLGVPQIVQQLKIEALALEDLPADQWRIEQMPGAGWKAGIEVPEFLDREAYVVQITNLKAHRFGGIFSASLKNSIGLIAKHGCVKAGYNYMKELHNSADQGSLIAEANSWYEPRLVIMDALQVFATGGPEDGQIVDAEVIMASADRVAIDAAGAGLLRLLRETPGQPAEKQTVFEQEQLKRAVELNLGAANATEIQFRTPDSRSSILASQIETILREPAKSKKL